MQKDDIIIVVVIGIVVPVVLSMLYYMMPNDVEPTSNKNDNNCLQSLYRARTELVKSSSLAESKKEEEFIYNVSKQMERCIMLGSSPETYSEELYSKVCYIKFVLLERLLQLDNNRDFFKSLCKVSYFVNSAQKELEPDSLINDYEE